jgi:hypothetical protein
MGVLDISPRLLEQVKWIAEWQQVTVNQVAVRAVSSYADLLEWQKLETEMAAFQAQLPALLAAYPGQYVAIHDGEVIDCDIDLRALHSRVYARMGTIPMLDGPARRIQLLD